MGRNMLNSKLNRRQILKGFAAAAAAAALPAGARAQIAPNGADPRFLIVMTGTGGASIVDAMLAVPASQSANAAGLNVYPDAMIQRIGDLPFSAIDQELRDIGPLPYRGPANQSDFVRRHGQDMMAVTHTGTSVNHLIAQKRALTGNDAWTGNTLQEIVAATYGQGFPVPNVNMSSGGYLEPGIDTQLPDFARAEPVIDPKIWALGLDGNRGVDQAPPRSALDSARRFRDTIIEAPDSGFNQTFGASPDIARWKAQRVGQVGIEEADLIRKLTFLPDTIATPLNRFGLAPGPDAARVREVFPLWEIDPMEAQGALAYLLIKNRVSVTVTIGPSSAPVVGGQQTVDSPPLAFDFSHSAHRATQALMWSRMLSVVDRLIGLLKAEEFGGGESFWDRSLVYFATDFGRSRRRPENAEDFGTGHDLNNGSLIVSPLANGGKILGGVDPDTVLTYGFDPSTGAPDTGRTMNEPEIFAGILQALSIDTSPARLPDMRAMRRG